ncbi:MAG: hypothetical protein AAF191_20905, partial [Verrucomicrobiota bacterium]
LARKICVPLREAKCCLGYSYFDMPDLRAVRPWQRTQFPDKGLIYPWVRDMRKLPSRAPGKNEWIRILKINHSSAAEAARVYALESVASWEELSATTEWPAEPNEVEKALRDADDMLASLADRWYGLHHEMIRKYDPNHLLLGDKHDVGYAQWVERLPDGVVQAMAKYNDILLIQYYSYYTDLHNETLRDLYQRSGLPIINGDHAYVHQTERHSKIKGLEMESFEAVGAEYQRYLQRSLAEHPYLLGGWYCGYIAQWAPSGSERLGQQGGFFSPFGEPNLELLPFVKEANEKAVGWHRGSAEERG